jgi:DnaK suppressor protein
LPAGMETISTSLPAMVESTGVAPRPRNSGSAARPGLGRWRLALQTRWQRKIDEVVILSQARSGLTSEPDETAPGVRRSGRLGARIDAALDQVVAIEEALARLDDGSYGICAGCDRPMAAEWLADTPETRYCPDCSLHLVSWQPPSKRKVQAVRRADAPDASAEAQQGAPKPTEPKRHQVRRPAPVCRL